MTKHTMFKDNDIKKYYILTRPVKLSDMSFDEIDGEYDDEDWREKSRRLQARRWRKIRHQLA
ncbi:MAG TPA: hypothetical protein VFK97_01965 [Candidatus Saccharimonadales bacterium]|nr:hypothetical protein [Candidatus Saccharimonadales bacterium]